MDRSRFFCSVSLAFVSCLQSWWVMARSSTRTEASIRSKTVSTDTFWRWCWNEIASAATVGLVGCAVPTGATLVMLHSVSWSLFVGLLVCQIFSCVLTGGIGVILPIIWSLRGCKNRYISTAGAVHTFLCILCWILWSVKSMKVHGESTTSETEL